MNNRSRRALLLITGALIAFLLACRVGPGFARGVLARVSLPGLRWLHRMTAPVPFPVAEVLATALLGALAFALCPAAVRSIAARSAAPLVKWAADAAWTALLLGCALALLWAPARALPVQPAPMPDDAQLQWLCESLIGQLNGAALDFPTQAETLERAPAVAGLPGRVVKAARYPEWMDIARAWGIFVPLTGEALVDTESPAPLAPFTAVHELMHLTGIADEGEANIAAWERCVDAGGAFEASARLWALRYAMGLLRARDEAAWASADAKMEDALARVFRMCGGEAVSAGKPSPLPSLRCGDYAALVCRLAFEGRDQDALRR